MRWAVVRGMPDAGSGEPGCDDMAPPSERPIVTTWTLLALGDVKPDFGVPDDVSVQVRRRRSALSKPLREGEGARRSARGLGEAAQQDRTHLM